MRRTDLPALTAARPGRDGGGCPGQDRDVSRLDDFEVIEERQRLTAALTKLTERCRVLNNEISKRKTLRWMLAP
jgi:hypothetical protein